MLLGDVAEGVAHEALADCFGNVCVGEPRGKARAGRFEVDRLAVDFSGQVELGEVRSDLFGSCAKAGEPVPGSWRRTKNHREVLDFGITKIKGDAAAIMETTGLTNTGGMLGSPRYKSPEQVRRSKTVDPGARWVVLACYLDGSARLFRLLFPHSPAFHCTLDELAVHLRDFRGA